MAIRSRIPWSLLLAGLSFLPQVFSQTGSRQDKRAYNLFNPTPENLLRELTTDRPDKTESPYTVDAGHFQLEMDLLSYTRDGEVENFAIAPANFKIGLLNNVDLQVIAATYNIQRTRDRAARPRESISGFGDLLVRLKVNFWGNDGARPLSA